MASAEVVSRIENSVEGENLTNGHEVNGDHQSANATNGNGNSSDSEKLSPNGMGGENSDDLNLATHSDLVNGLAVTDSLNTLLADSNSYKESVDVFAINNMLQQMSVIDSSPTPQSANNTSFPGGNWGRYPTADGIGNYSGGNGNAYDQYQRSFSGYAANGSANNQQSGMYSKRPITRGQQQQLGALPFNGNGNRGQQAYGQPGKFQQQQNWNQPNGGMPSGQQPGYGNGNYQGFSQWGNQPQQQGNFFGSNQQQPGNMQQQQQAAAFRRCTSVPNHMGMRGGYMGSKSVEYSPELAAALAENGNGQNGGPGYPAVQQDMKNGGSPTGVGVNSAGSSASPSGQQSGVQGGENGNFVPDGLLESLMRTSHEQYKGPQQLGLLDENAPYLGEELNANALAGFDQASGPSVFGVVPGANGPSAAQQQIIAAMGGGQGMMGAGNFGNSEKVERFSRKVFVGGLPPDIDEDEIRGSFQQFGALVVDWPHKNESRSYFPPKGYCFLLFQDELSVQLLINVCLQEKGRLFWPVSSPTMKDKMVQIRPWSLTDSDFVMDGQQPIDPRKTIFVGGVPRPLRASELAMIMNDLYGGVCYAGIDVDPELKYPKGAGRVAFSTQQAYIAAISARFVQLRHADIDKRVEVKPYVLDDQMCDECQGQRCSGKFAPFFCANVTCLQYYCEYCWAQIHSRPGREFHKPLVKEGADRPRAVPFRWY